VCVDDFDVTATFSADVEWRGEAECLPGRQTDDERHA